MSTTTVNASLKLRYEDNTTRQYSLPIKDGTTLETMKTAIQAFNTAAATTGSTVKQTFVSNDGAAVAEIVDAVQVTRTEDVIYSG